MHDEAAPAAATRRTYSIDARTDGASPALLFAGELDVAAAADIRDAIVATVPDDGREVVVDLRQVTFIDSCGLEALLAGQRDARRRGGDIEVHPGDGAVARLLGLTGLGDAVTMRRA